MKDVYLINGREYEWADISLIVGSVPIVGFRAVSYKRECEKEAMFAKGRKAHSIQSGNELITGNITFTQSQFEAIEAATGGNVLTTKVDIIVSYGAEMNATSVASSAISTDIIIGAEFTEYEKGMAQGDKFMEIAMPFLALDIKNA
ncbi:hypothetical protein [Limibacterium fermenti]|uniref:hypothetical protein n=1 Tax=Limibacterium fermenti TaxID=3229863 RepID=UPI000E8083CE|nr:hypothetical protein [Porphyromonadaceae bacterium]